MILSSFFSISIEQLLLIEELISNLRMNSVKDTINRAIRPMMIIRYTIEIIYVIPLHSFLFSDNITYYYDPQLQIIPKDGYLTASIIYVLLLETLIVISFKGGILQ